MTRNRSVYIYFILLSFSCSCGPLGQVLKSAIDPLTEEKIVTEPTTQESCKEYSSKQAKGQCENYVKAKEHFADKKYSNALSKLEKSKLDETEFGKKFKEEIKIKKEAAGKPMPLDVSQVVAIDLIIEGDAICPSTNSKISIGFSAEIKDGTILTTWTNSKEKEGHPDFSEFVLETEHGEFQKNIFKPNPDILATMNSGFAFKISLANRPEISLERVIPPTYSCMEGVWFYGERGQSGRDGRNGEDYGSSHTSNTHGRNGGNGGTGGNGSNGGDGPEVIAHAGYISTTYFPKLLIIKATSEEQVVWFAAPADNLEKVTVTAKGGSGGRGGSGGSGGRGQDADQGYTPGDGGNGGDGGHGGDGGKGGKLTIMYDKRHKELKNIVIGSTPGGSGGDSGNTGFGDSGGWAGNDVPRGLKGEQGRSGDYGRSGPGGSKTKYKAVSSKSLFSEEKLKLK